MGKIISSVASALKRSLKRQNNILEILNEQNRFGWEKWLQVELAFELSKSNTPRFEVSYPYSQAKRRPHSKMAFSHYHIDLEFRAHNHLKDYVSAVEIKLDPTQKGLRKTLTDLRRIRATKTKSWMFRSVVIIFIYGKSDSRETKYNRLINDLQNDFKAICDSQAGYKYVVFGWEQSLRKNMTFENYKAWLNDIEEAFRNHVKTVKTISPRAYDKKD